MFRCHPQPIVRLRAGSSGLILAIAALTLSGCERGTPEPAATEAQADATVAGQEPLPVVVPTRAPALTRRDLIDAAAAAASAYAAGTKATGEDPLVGRRFSVRLSFGCGGQGAAANRTSQESGLPAARRDTDRKSIRLHMLPGDWSGSELVVEAGASDKWEALEGFWIPRPWLATDGCPAVATDPLQTGIAPVSPQTLGIAAVFEAGGSRLGRRNGRPYEYTVRAKGDAMPEWPGTGFTMVLEGRMTSFPGGRAIACRASGPDQRPICIAAAQLDRVAFEGADGDTLGEWRPG